MSRTKTGTPYQIAVEIAVAAIYFGAARLGLSLAFLNASVSPVWPPTGVAIAAVVLLGYRILPAVLVGAFLANLATGLPIATAAGIAIGNTLEAATAGYLLHRFVGTRNPFNRTIDVLKFAVIAGGLSTAVAATIGNITLCLSGSANWTHFGSLWLTWWLGDGTGALMVAPLFITWAEGPSERWPPARWAEAGALFLSVSVIAVLIFGGVNMRKLGFQIHYDYQDAICHYEPDFVVRLTNGTMLILEIKGKAGELHEPDRVNAKSQAARKWVAAVNNAKCYGEWDYQICREIPALAATLQELAGVLPSSTVLPFRSVRNPTGEQRFKTCVPLTTLRAAARYWSEEQMSLEGIDSIANDWVEYDTTAQFKPGMFVARVVGDSMEQLIPANSYCLFRQPGIGSRRGKKALVWHRDVTDSDTGGQYTVKVYDCEKRVTEDEREHTRITLKPLNPKYEPIVLRTSEEGDVRVLAEFVEVVGAAPVVE